MHICSLVSWGGLRLSPVGTVATVWPIVPGPDKRWWWLWSSRWNENWQGKPKYSEITCPSATLSTTNPTWTDLGSNTGRRGGNPVTNRLSYGHDPAHYVTSGRRLMSQHQLRHMYLCLLLLPSVVRYLTTYSDPHSCVIQSNTFPLCCQKTFRAVN
jgi:hypothetical protein